jgi:hypothetical protein
MGVKRRYGLPPGSSVFFGFNHINLPHQFTAHQAPRKDTRGFPDSGDSEYAITVFSQLSRLYILFERYGLQWVLQYDTSV